MVAVSNFSGLTSSICALAKAAAKLLMDGLDRCMVGLRGEKIKADRSRLRALGTQAMADGLLSVLGHQAFQLSLRLLVLHVDSVSPRIYRSEFRPRVGRRHVDDAH